MAKDKWKEGMPDTDPSIVAPPGLLQPIRGFGLAWRTSDNPTGRPLRGLLGWAVEEERGYTARLEYWPGTWRVSVPSGETYYFFEAERAWSVTRATAPPQPPTPPVTPPTAPASLTPTDRATATATNTPQPPPTVGAPVTFDLYPIVSRADIGMPTTLEGVVRLHNTGGRDARNIRWQISAAVAGEQVRVDFDRDTLFIPILKAGTEESRPFFLTVNLSLGQGTKARDHGIDVDVTVVSDETQQTFKYHCSPSGAIDKR